MNLKESLPPVSKSGFLLGAALALAAVAVKIVFLNEMDEKNESQGASRESVTTVHLSTRPRPGPAARLFMSMSGSPCWN